MNVRIARFFTQLSIVSTHRLINRILLFICLGWTALLVGCSDTDVTTLGDWQTRSDLDGVGRSAATGFVIGNIAYIGTGTTSVNDLLKDFWAYNQSTNAWTQVANFGGLPVTRLLVSLWVPKAMLVRV
ncbi:hypothetical protein [Spirosoma telluris]|uniref:hypothetical protein n=1 Tax=Spirosoma telluris TaxID=2183553 RepID=UPI002FC292E8